MASWPYGDGGSSKTRPDDASASPRGRHKRCSSDHDFVMRPVTGRAVISHDVQKPEARSGTQEQVCDGCLLRRYCIGVFSILADVVKVKKGSGSTVHWSIDFIRLSGWLRRCFTLLITPAKIGKTAIPRTTLLGAF